MVFAQSLLIIDASLRLKVIYQVRPAVSSSGILDRFVTILALFIKINGHFQTSSIFVL